MGVYFYPDFTTVIVGLWEDHLLVQVIVNHGQNAANLYFDESQKG